MMAKDPAFLFYSSDFLTGTMFMSYEQIGLYIKMLCVQHQHGGRIDTNVLRNECNRITGGDTVLNKFMHDERGSYSERLNEEMEKRKEKSVKASESIKKRWAKHKYDSNTNVLRSENENEDVNEDVNTRKPNIPKHDQTKLKQIEVTCFDEFLDKNCPTLRKLKIQMTSEQAERLMSEYGADACLQIFEAMENWVPLTKKSKSVYLTAKNWLSKRQTTQANGKPAKPTFTEAATNWLDQTSRGSVFGS